MILQHKQRQNHGGQNDSVAMRADSMFPLFSPVPISRFDFEQELPAPSLVNLVQKKSWLEQG